MSVEPRDQPAEPSPQAIPIAANEEVDWAALISAAANKRPAIVKAETFLRRRATASQPVDLGCVGGKAYVVKALRNDLEQGRMMFNDHVVAHFGALLNAPVPAVALIEISQELISLNPDKTKGMGHLKPCVAHGSLRQENVSERIDNIDYIADDDNRNRFALHAVLHAWIGGADRQFIYENAAPFSVYAVDHGHFFPNGPNWSVSDIKNAPAPRIEPDIIAKCKFSPHELATACESLREVTDEDIAYVLAIPPDAWGVTIAERVAVSKYLSKRRSELIEMYLPRLREEI